MMRLGSTLTDAVVGQTTQKLPPVDYPHPKRPSPLTAVDLRVEDALLMAKPMPGTAAA